MKVLVDLQPDPAQMLDDSGVFVAPFSVKDAKDADGKQVWVVEAQFVGVDSLVQAVKRATRGQATVKILDDSIDIPSNAELPPIAAEGEEELTEALQQARSFIKAQRTKVV